jgi:hypothetical protein
MIIIGDTAKLTDYFEVQTSFALDFPAILRCTISLTLASVVAIDYAGSTFTFTFAFTDSFHKRLII